MNLGIFLEIILFAENDIKNYVVSIGEGKGQRKTLFLYCTIMNYDDFWACPDSQINTL